jgi:hypothetical protein
MLLVALNAGHQQTFLETQLEPALNDLAVAVAPFAGGTKI